MTGDTGSPRSRVPVLLVVLGVLLALVAVAGISARPGGTGSAAAPADPSAPLVVSPAIERLIIDSQAKLRRLPTDSLTWAKLGAAYVEQARITADPTYLNKSQGALERSLEIKPDDNGEAALGMGVLANARHDFRTAKDWIQKALVLRPDSGQAYGALADALTNLGETEAANAAMQGMLDRRPGQSAFTRVSYLRELAGDVDGARQALERALATAYTPDEVSFIRYYLGDLDFNNGRLDAAAEQYEGGLVAVPGNVLLLQGRAKVAAARGDSERAVTGYRELTDRYPLPQYLLEYGELLQSLGRTDEARQQYELLAAQQQLYSTQGSTDDQVASLIQADHGDPAEALRLAETEWGRRQSVFSADALAWALHVNGRDAEALPYADRAVAGGWRNATYYYHRGMIVKSLGRTEDARAALSEALAINPEFSPLRAPLARQALAEVGGAR